MPADGTGGLTWRPLTTDDVPAWAEVVTAIESVDQPAERLTADDLLDELVKGSWKDPVRDSLVGLDPGGVPRAFGLVATRPGDLRVIRAHCFGGVHPQWRRRGAGTAVLTWQHHRALEKIAAARSGHPDGDSVPGRVMAFADEQLTDRAKLFERCGFASVRWYVDMVRPLTVAGAAPVPEATLGDGLRVAPFEPGLDEAVRLAHNESFAGHWGSEPRSAEDWRLWTTGQRDFRPEWSFVVLDGDDVSGYALSGAYPQDWAAQGYTQGWTDLLGVRPAWRRRGIAAALLGATMRAFARDGMEYAGLGVDSENASGALGVYERMGYVQDRRQVAFAIDV